MPRPTSDQAEQRDIAQRILHAALALFARLGFAATSTREIIEAAGVTKPMIYYYFESKEGLGRAVLTRFLDEFYARLEETVADTSREPRDYLVEVVWAHLDYCRQYPDFARFFYACFFGPDGHLLGLDLIERTSRGQELLQQAVRRVIAQKLVARRHEPRLMLALNGLINICVITAIKGTAPLTRNLARQVVDDLLTGFLRRD